MYVLYYASMLRCWYIVRILVRTDHPYLGVGCHSSKSKFKVRSSNLKSQVLFSVDRLPQLANFGKLLESN
jgi:hypothetical protein